MEALTTTTAAVALPIFSPNKPRDASSRRLVRFCTSPKNDRNCSNSNGDSDLDSYSSDSALVPIFRNRTLSKDAAMGLVLSAANVRGWTTGSGMEGPPVPAADPDSGTDQVSTFPWSLFTKSPRRRMRVAFTCKVCGQRTTRAINPHAYTDGTVFVQEMKCYVNSSFNPNQNNNMSFKYFELDEDNNEDDSFPLL